MKHPDNTEIIVIGGGLFGCSTAYRLAQKGREVMLVEQSNIASGASGRNGGQVIQLDGRDRNPATIRMRLELTRENNRLLEELAGELDTDLEYRRIGSLDVAFSDAEWRELREVARIQRAAGDNEVELLSRRETLKICPVLTDRARGSRYRPSDGTINPFFYTHGYARGLRRAGGQVLTNTPVKRILRESGRVTGVELAAGHKIRARKVVNTTNAWSSFLIPEIDILPLRQTAVVTEPTSSPPVCPVEAFIGGDAVYTNIEAGSGNLVAGGLRATPRTRAEQYDTRVDYEEVRGGSAIFSFLYPGLREISIIRAWAGTMALGPDFQPAIGEVPENKGLYIAAGFYNGMAFATMVGLLLAELVVTGKAPAPLKPFDPARFYEKDFQWPEIYNCTRLAEFFTRK